MATAKKRLGRGLGSIISDGAAQSSKAGSRSSDTKGSRRSKSKQSAPVLKEPRPKAQPAEAPPSLPYREIAVGEIKPSPYQPRRSISEERIRELADSIRSEGLLQPVVVRPAADHFQLIAGERRWRAHKLLGIKAIPARVIEAPDASAAVISLIENLQRESLNPIEESLAFASLMRDFDLTQEAVAERVGKGRATVANALRLLNLDRQTQGYIAQGLLSAGHAKVILGLEDAARRTLLANRIIEQGLSVRETEKIIKTWVSGGNGRNAATLAGDKREQTVIEDLEKRIGSSLNTKVQLKHTPRRGKLIIEYQGNDDLQRILDKLGIDA